MLAQSRKENMALARKYMDITVYCPYKTASLDCSQGFEGGFISVDHLSMARNLALSENIVIVSGRFVLYCQLMENKSHLPCSWLVLMSTF